MYKFGKTSLEKLETLHPDLQKVANVAIQIVDFSIISGHRGKEEQDRYYRTGASQKKFPESKHNQSPSMAFDFCPYPCNWNDTKQFIYICGIFKGIAATIGVSLRTGSDWTNDGVLNTHKEFNDFGHVELV